MTSHRGIFCLAVLLSIILFLPCACSNRGSQAKKPASPAQQKPEEPASFKKIVNYTDAIIMELCKKAAAGEGLLPQMQGQSDGGEQGKDTGSKSSKSRDITSVFDKEQKAVKRIHQYWNSVEPEALKAGLSSTVRNNFEKNLDDLTILIGQKNAEEGLLKAISLYRDYGDIIPLFNSRTPPAYYRFKYETMTATALAGTGEWDGAEQHLPGTEEQWQALKSSSEIKNTMLLIQTDYAVTDFIQAFDRREKELVLINSEIVMKNLERLIEKINTP